MSFHHFRICSGCGLPPSKGPDGNEISLKTCSRCKRVAYHDVSCQKAHFPKHRSQCQPTKLERMTRNDSRGKLGYIITEKDGRGKCLLASEHFPNGRKLASSTNPKGGFTPLVPSVLNSLNRADHCVLCMSRTSPTRSGHIKLSKLQKNTVVVCSKKCEEACRQWVVDEIACVDAVAPRFPIILPTALLVYRIMRAIALNQLDRQAILSLQSHTVEENDDAQSHESAVQMTVLSLIAETKENHKFPRDLVSSILARVKYNAFTLPDHATGRALGFGIFDTAYRINHSCSPNSVQTYSLGVVGELPHVHITTTKDVMAGEEITISYIDENQSKEVRQALLKRNYRFNCSCNKCQKE